MPIINFSLATESPAFHNKKKMKIIYLRINVTSNRKYITTNNYAQIYLNTDVFDNIKMFLLFIHAIHKYFIYQ